MRLVKLCLGLLVCLVALAAAGVWYVLVQQGAAPADFTSTAYTVAPGSTISTVARDLEEAGVIRSAITLQVLFAYEFSSTALKAGTYTFRDPQSTRMVAETLVQGQFDADLLTLTFIEGQRASDYAAVADAALPAFDVTAWTTLATEAEGQLFPDTYRVPPTYTAQALFTLLQEQHQTVLAELRAAYPDNTLSDDTVRTLASIVEREANSPESMRLVAGIFQNRLDIGMPLQADASIEYVIDTPLGELRPGELAQNLRDLDSPYNTYLYAGLPPTPIGNPGRQALSAVLDPVPSDYLYYLTGNDGEFYYAETYNQHLVNIERHLR